MEWWMIGVSALFLWFVAVLMLSVFTGKVLKRLNEIEVHLDEMEERRKRTPPHDTPLRVPYEDRLKAEYAKRGIPWDESIVNPVAKDLESRYG